MEADRSASAAGTRDVPFHGEPTLPAQATLLAQTTLLSMIQLQIMT
jgi:hypothetical protein